MFPRKRRFRDLVAAVCRSYGSKLVPCHDLGFGSRAQKALSVGLSGAVSVVFSCTVCKFLNASEDQQAEQGPSRRFLTAKGPQVQLLLPEVLVLYKPCGWEVFGGNFPLQLSQLGIKRLLRAISNLGFLGASKEL